MKQKRTYVEDMLSSFSLKDPSVLDLCPWETSGAQTICSNPQLLQKEEHLQSALRKCKYPNWALNKIRIKAKKQATNKDQTNITNTINNQKSYIVVPYYSGLSESIKKTGSKYRVQVHFKEGTIIKNLLMFPKDKDPLQKRSGVIFRYQCDRVECDEEYIGESSRTFGERFKEHLKAPSPYMTRATSLVTMSPSKILALWEGKT